MQKHIGNSLRLFACALVLGTATMAHAFDTGPHQDLTREVMAEVGMNDEANRTVQLENWLSDYYSNQPIAGTKSDLEKLHFDALTNTESVTRYWSRLTLNTKNAVQGAAKEKNPMKVLALTGMSLHAVQDFYTHSNWVETHPAPAGSDYNTVTWFDTKNRTGVRTGNYPNSKTKDPNDHGDYDYGINHDSQSRPEFGRAYVFGYAASRQWVHQIREWVSEIDPQVWTDAQHLKLSDDDKRGLANGMEAAYRISLWITAGGKSGTWKGKGSGYSAGFASMTAGWMASSGGVFTKHFKDDKWQQLLTGGQGDALNLKLPESTDTDPEADAVPKVAHVPMNKKVVLVRTTEIKELPTKFFEAKIDVGGKADFWAKITIGGMTFIENTYQDRDNVGHPWETIKFVDDSVESVDIRIEVWDEDLPTKADDHCDICNGGGYDQVLKYNTNSRLISGTINGVFDGDNKTFGEGGNEKDRAFIRGFITTRTLAKPEPDA